jgi:formylglycine-generating enzyme required for sulfatase activity
MKRTTQCFCMVVAVLVLSFVAACGNRRPVQGSESDGTILGNDVLDPGDPDLGPVVIPDGMPTTTPDMRIQPGPDGPGASPKCPGGWCKAPAGTFKMGSPATEPCREKGSGMETQHSVTISRPFMISATEVTQDQFKAAMGYNPSYFSSCGGDCPVEMVNWHEAAAYANALSKKLGLTACYTCSGGSTGEVVCDVAPAYVGSAPSYSGSKIYGCPGYRLPTEAEWEYAYRADTQNAFYSGDIVSCHGDDPSASKIGWYDLNSGLKPHPVGKRAANAWGLRDMAGNVFEWVHDRFVFDLGGAKVTDPAGPASGDSHILRGGSWFNFARVLRAAYRGHKTAKGRYYHLGFRVVRTTQP